MHFVSVAHFFVETHTEAGQGNHLKKMTFQRSRDHTRGEGDPPGVKSQSTGEGLGSLSSLCCLLLGCRPAGRPVVHEPGTLPAQTGDLLVKRQSVSVGVERLMSG